jgi:hypothetical protein
MKKYLCLIFAIFLFTGCTKDELTIKPATNAVSSTIVYRVEVKTGGDHLVSYRFGEGTLLSEFMKELVWEKTVKVTKRDQLPVVQLYVKTGYVNTEVKTSITVNGQVKAQTPFTLQPQLTTTELEYTLKENE